MEKIDGGSFTNFDAEDARNSSEETLLQALAYAASRQKLGAVLMLAQEECKMLQDERKAPVSIPSDSELMRRADSDDWASVAYFLAHVKEERGPEGLAPRLNAPDVRARRVLRRAAGEVLVKVPYDLCVAYTKAGQLGPDLFVEQQRWMLPRPNKDLRFLVAGDPECQKCRREEQPDCGHARGQKLAEGWYSVVQYPFGDFPELLRKGVFRRKDWKQQARKEAAATARQVGETMLCKAAKAKQWELVAWMLENCEDAVELAKQVEEEWQRTWDDDAVWRAKLQDLQDLADLLRCFDDADEGEVRLRSSWHRGGAVSVPAGAVLRYPRLETLREAFALEEKKPGIALEALRMVGCCEVTLALSSALSGDAHADWLRDLEKLAEGDEVTFGMPLLHRTALAGHEEVLTQLLEAMVDPNVQDLHGRTALAAAAKAGRWEACKKLLNSGCRADGRNGEAALKAARLASRAAEKQGASEREVEDARRAADMLGEIYKRQERPPAASLTDFFARQVQGEVMAGIEPRLFRLEQGELKTSKAGPQIWARGMIVGSGLGGEGGTEAEPKEPRTVVFAVLDPSSYEAARTAAALEVGRGRKLLPEELLLKAGEVQAMAISVPVHRLAAEKGSGTMATFNLEGLQEESSCHYATVTEWGRRMRRQVGSRARRKMPQSSGATPSLGSRAQVIRSDGVAGSRFAAHLPVLARAPPTGSLRVESFTCCCGEPVGRVDLVVDGICLGATAIPPGEEVAELEVHVPPKELEVIAEMSGRQLLTQRMTCGESEELRVDVSVGVYVYCIPIEDEELAAEIWEMMVFVAGHRADIPEEGKPFIGSITWDSGQARLDSLRPVHLGGGNCLEHLRSLQLLPDLRAGRTWQPVEWEDTSTEEFKACQFQRVLNNPVRVGNIVNV